MGMYLVVAERAAHLLAAHVLVQCDLPQGFIALNDLGSPLRDLLCVWWPACSTRTQHNNSGQQRQPGLYEQGEHTARQQGLLKYDQRPLTAAARPQGSPAAQDHIHVHPLFRGVGLEVSHAVHCSVEPTFAGRLAQRRLNRAFACPARASGCLLHFSRW